MQGTYVKQINNIVITVKNNVYVVWDPTGALLLKTSNLNEAMIYCEKNKQFVLQAHTVKTNDQNMFYNKEPQIQLCHGSIDVIQRPYFGGGDNTNDFGSGFYTVSVKNKELAKEWACSIYGNKTTAYVNNYVLDTTGLKILNLDKLDIIYWVALTATYRGVNTLDRQTLQALQRNYLLDLSEYDCIYGWRCDDTYSKIIRNFLAENLSAEAIKEAVHLGCLQEQFVLKSERSFERIKFISAEPIQDISLYSQRFNKRKLDADGKVDALKRKYRFGKYVGDYI